MSSARRVRRKYYALQEKRIDDLRGASQPLGNKATDLRDAMVADRAQQQGFEEQEDQRARARRQRSMAATAQYLVILLAVGALGVTGAALVLHPTLLAGLGLGAVLATIVGLLVTTWRWALRDGRERDASWPAPQQLVFDFVAARRRRRLA